MQNLVKQNPELLAGRAAGPDIDSVLGYIIDAIGILAVGFCISPGEYLDIKMPDAEAEGRAGAGAGIRGCFCLMTGFAVIPFPFSIQPRN